MGQTLPYPKLWRGFRPKVDALTGGVSFLSDIWGLEIPVTPFCAPTHLLWDGRIATPFHTP